jgi:hypothetical protein
MFLFKEIPDAAPYGAGEGPGGLLHSHGLRRGLEDVAATAASGDVAGSVLHAHDLRRGLKDCAAAAA